MFNVVGGAAAGYLGGGALIKSDNYSEDTSQSLEFLDLKLVFLEMTQLTVHAANTNASGDGVAALELLVRTAPVGGIAALGEGRCQSGEGEERKDFGLHFGWGKLGSERSEFESWCFGVGLVVGS